MSKDTEPRKCSRRDPETGETCSNPAGKKHPWCNRCQVAYQGKHAKSRETQAEERGQARGWVRGIRAFRITLTMELDRVADTVNRNRPMFTLEDMRKIIEAAPSPAYQGGNSVDPSGSRILG